MEAIHRFAREGTEPPQHLSFVEVSGLAFAPGSRYPALGDSLFVCESQKSVIQPATAPTKGVLRRLVLGGADLNEVTANDVIVKDCKGDLAVAADGTIYYANDSEIRRLLPGEESVDGARVQRRRCPHDLNAGGGSARGAPPGQPFEPILRSRDVVIVAIVGGGLIAALLAVPSVFRRRRW